MNKKISSSIVLFKNDITMLRNAIDSFLNTELNVSLYLIDNSPSDNLKKICTDNRIIYLHNPSNPGFGASHNIAILRSLELQSDYHIILNPDIYFSPGTLENLLEFMEKNKDIGHVMPKILYPNGEFQYLCKTNPTFFDLFSRGFLPRFLKKIIKKRLDKFTYKNADFNNVIYDVPYLSGCFMFFRSTTLEQVGFFDDKFFMYLEDADITRRFLEISRTAYYPGATVYHHYAGLTHKKWKYKWITIQSAFIYFNKWGWIKSIF
jgi:GT2 family glycosyltransferase